VSTLLDQETVVLEGLDFEPPCEDRNTPAHAATHTAQCRACGKVLLVCEAHLAYLRWRYARRCVHVPCETEAPGFDLLFDWRPL